jgi:ABC-type transport system involved in multi-copper enzyme maturation permease subunit
MVNIRNQIKMILNVVLTFVILLLNYSVLFFIKKEETLYRRISFLLIMVALFVVVFPLKYILGSEYKVPLTKTTLILLLSLVLHIVYFFIGYASKAIRKPLAKMNILDSSFNSIFFHVVLIGTTICQCFLVWEGSR